GSVRSYPALSWLPFWSVHGITGDQSEPAAMIAFLSSCMVLYWSGSMSGSGRVWLLRMLAWVADWVLARLGWCDTRGLAQSSGVTRYWAWTRARSAWAGSAPRDVTPSSASLQLNTRGRRRTVWRWRLRIRCSGCA